MAAELEPVRVGGYIVAYRPKKDGAPSSAYSKMLKADLEAEVATRGLDVTGTKADLIAALEANDAQ